VREVVAKKFDYRTIILNSRAQYMLHYLMLFIECARLRATIRGRGRSYVAARAHTRSHTATRDHTGRRAPIRGRARPYAVSLDHTRPRATIRCRARPYAAARNPTGAREHTRPRATIRACARHTRPCAVMVKTKFNIFGFGSAYKNFYFHAHDTI